MKFIAEFKSFYKEKDIVLIHYWYNHMITPVRIIEKKGNKFLVSHDVEKSKIKNAPEELISTNDIIDIYRS
jgi:hypothetical protein